IIFLFTFPFRILAVVFFFQAEDGIRDRNVTGVQTCALPICSILPSSAPSSLHRLRTGRSLGRYGAGQTRFRGRWVVIGSSRTLRPWRHTGCSPEVARKL